VHDRAAQQNRETLERLLNLRAMADQAARTHVNWRQAAGEALLIFLGVAGALFGQAWWEDREDRHVEQHLLNGIRADLSRDTSDAARVVSAARARIVGADRLLQVIGDPDAGVLQDTPPWVSEVILMSRRQAFELALAEYDTASIPPQQALQMVSGTFAIQSLDLSAASYSEATATGGLDAIQNLDLRTQIADYYAFATRLSRTADTRAESHWRRLREVLADAGLSAVGGEPDARLLTVLGNDRILVAELKNAREFAVGQAAAQLIARAKSLISQLEDELRP